MTGIAAPRMRGGPMPSIAPSDRLTHVELTWVEKQIEYWIRFGDHAQETILDRRRRVLSFRPGTVFAFVRWASNDFGTIISLPFVRPGGDILLKIESWPKVERVLQLIDVIEAMTLDPAAAAPDYWRHVHNRLTAGHEPRSYTRAQHEAWLKRRRIAP